MISNYDLSARRAAVATRLFQHVKQRASTCAIASLFLFFTLISLTVSSSEAKADLRLCNKTEGKVGVAIGYHLETEWLTEGWWNLPPNTCETLIGGQLTSRYYYIYAFDYGGVDGRVGEWGGPAYMCTRQKEFTIKGIEDCVARGYERTGFFEVDTGEQASWTIQLTEPMQEGTGAR